jgi:hypothetical protein
VAQANFAVAAGNNCDPNFGFLQAGSRTAWSPVPGFYLAAELLYAHVWSAFQGGAAINSATVGARPTGAYAFNNQGTWSYMFRAQRNFNAGSD